MTTTEAPKCHLCNGPTEQVYCVDEKGKYLCVGLYLCQPCDTFVTSDNFRNMSRLEEEAAP